MRSEQQQGQQGEDLRSEVRQRRGRLVLQSLPIVLIPFATLMVTFLIVRATMPLALPPREAPAAPAWAPFVPLALAVVFISALIMLVRIGRPTASAIALIGVWTMLTTFTALRFGVTTYFPALLIIPICAAGLLIDRVASVALALLATGLVVASGWAEAGGALAPVPGFPEAALPFVRYISVGFWVGLFWSVAGLTALLAGGLNAALRQSVERAEQLRRLSEELEARVARQTALLLEQERAAAALEERGRLAREIHDTIAQGLAGIAVQVSAAERALASGSPAVGQHLELAGGMAREALAEARRSVWNLRAGSLERGSLGDALAGLAERQRALGLEASYAQRGDPFALRPEAEQALLRVGQEALANIARHAGASRAALELRYAGGWAELTVRDDGVGFDEEVLAGAGPSGPSGGFGLRGMRERLAALGGELRLENDGGALLAARVPRGEGA